MKPVVAYFHERRRELPRNMRSALDRYVQRKGTEGSGLWLPKPIAGVVAAPNLYGMLMMNSAQIDGGALTASITATSLLPAQAKPIYTAQTARQGLVYLLFAAGRITNVVTTPGTLTLDVRFGSIIVANGGAMSLNVVAKTNVPWYLFWMLTCRAIGTTGNFMHQGTWTSESVIGSPLPTAGGAGTHLLPNAAPAVGSNVDLGANQTVDLFGTWSISNANSIQAHQFGFAEAN